MSGVVINERVAGIPNGFPAEMDASVKVRFVAPVLMNMSERSTDFLKWIGGVEQFSFNNTKIEWVEDDAWNRRLTHGGLAGGSTTLLTVTGAAHRYPVGTILYNVPDEEYVRVTGHPDVDTLQIQRDITAEVAEGAWANTDEVLVVGQSMHETDDYVFRPTSIMSLPYNVPQVFQTGVQASFRRMETALHGLKGSDLEKQSADLVAEQFVAIEDASIMSRRLDGTSGVPSMFGGIKFFVTSSNGAQVTSLSGNPLTRADIENELQDLFYTVGRDKVSLDLLCGAWAARKITTFFAGGEMIDSGATSAGISISSWKTEFGTVRVMMHTAVVKNELYLLTKENIQIGHHGTLGRPQLRQLPPSSVGPRSQKVFYGDLSMIVAGVQCMARIYNFATDA